MHDCRKFRENWIGGALQEPPGCEDCSRFCDDAGAVFKVLGTVSHDVPDHPERYWSDLDASLRTRLMEENIEKRLFASSWKWTASFATAAAIVFGMSWGTAQLLRSFTDPLGGKQTGRIEVVDDHIDGLDGRVVEYLGASELFLREFTKLEPSYIEDIEDSRIRASRDLAELTVQKSAAGDFAPVRIALDEYESVLRDIKNLESAEDIADIQNRIKRNGLIANFKAYQPRVVFVSQR